MTIVLTGGHLLGVLGEGGCDAEGGAGLAEAADGGEAAEEGHRAI